MGEFATLLTVLREYRDAGLVSDTQLSSFAAKIIQWAVMALESSQPGFPIGKN